MKPDREAKQIIVVRNDLRSKLRHGKLSVQVAHASMAAFHGDFELVRFNNTNEIRMEIKLTDAKASWIENAFAKVILRVDGLEELLELEQLCLNFELPHKLITDHGRTVFSEPTTTCIGIGPVWPEVLVGLTDELQMY